MAIASIATTVARWLWPNGRRTATTSTIEFDLQDGIDGSRCILACACVEIERPSVTLTLYGGVP